MSKLLMNERPLMVMPSLAVKIGLSEAIFLQQLHYWIEISSNVKEGHKWVYNTVQEWQEQFPFWSVSTIRRTIKSLETKDLIITANFNTMTIDKTKWYRINYQKLEEYETNSQIEQSSNQSEHSNNHNEQTRVQSDRHECSDWSDRVVKMNTPLPESTAESTSENNYYNDNNARVEEKVSDPSNQRAKENAFTFFEQNGFGMLGLHISDKINAWIEDISEELVLQAMKIAVENGAISWNYVETILRDWSSKKFKSLEDYEAHERKRAQDKSRKNTRPRGYAPPAREALVPDWFEQQGSEVAPTPPRVEQQQQDSSKESIEERRRKLREELANTSSRKKGGR